MGASTSLLPVDSGIVAVDDEVGEEISEYGLAAHQSLLLRRGDDPEEDTIVDPPPSTRESHDEKMEE